MKRAARGHVSDGLKTMSPGKLGIRCWVCPLPGVNIPDNWREVTPPEQMYASQSRGPRPCADFVHRFLYMLIIAMDTNFRLKNLH